MNLNSLAHRLKQYDKEEARSIVRLLLECRFNLSFTDICAGGLERMGAKEQALLESLMLRLEQGEPIQYVIGFANFCNRDFAVEPCVLIPRPETEELCYWIVQDAKNTTPTPQDRTILDIGTGSGCIAITLALDIPQTKVTAWDISREALIVACANADALKATNVTFAQKDILKEEVGGGCLYDIIVSNPPYICKKEADEMEQNVLEYEPHTALFVPDNDPLLFYRHIAEYAAKTLKPHGKLYFEINPLYAGQIKKMLAEQGFIDIIVKEDQFNKQRMIKALSAL